MSVTTLHADYQAMLPLWVVVCSLICCSHLRFPLTNDVKIGFNLFENTPCLVFANSAKQPFRSFAIVFCPIARLMRSLFAMTQGDHVCRNGSWTFGIRQSDPMVNSN